MSTKTSTFNLVKPELSDPADITSTNQNWDTIDDELSSINGKIVVATSSDGVSYTATEESIKELKVGLIITIVPSIGSSSSAITFNLNGFGSKNVRQPISVNNTAVATPSSDNWLVVNKPLQLQYDGTQWRAINLVRPSATDLYGTVPISSGGTGATTATDALANLGAAEADDSGAAKTALKFSTARTIDGVSFDGSSDILHYGTSSSQSTTPTKVVSCSGFVLKTGAKIYVKFTYGCGNTASDKTLTMNVNKTGAIEIRCGTPGNTTSASYLWEASEIVEFVYNGTYWIMLNPSFLNSSCNSIGGYSHVEGYKTSASALYTHTNGYQTVADAIYQTAIGSYNKSSTSNTDKFIIGKGTSSSRSNCFRATDNGVYASGEYNSSGADYAEMFEWIDGNPKGQDRVGKFVTLEGDKIRLATKEDNFILGVVSGNPSVVGDVYDDQWKGMYLTDIFGRPIMEDVEVPDEIGEYGEVIVPAHMEHRQAINPKYDSHQTFVPRSQRSEWDAVGLIGKLVVIDDGSCEVNGWCTPLQDGIATKSEVRTKYRVMSRFDDTHIRILILP